jgi:hypothetical protein
LSWCRRDKMLSLGKDAVAPSLLSLRDPDNKLSGLPGMKDPLVASATPTSKLSGLPGESCEVKPRGPVVVAGPLFVFVERVVDRTWSGERAAVAAHADKVMGPWGEAAGSDCCFAEEAV